MSVLDTIDGPASGPSGEPRPVRGLAVPRTMRRSGTPYLFLAPAIILFTLFLLAPIFYTGYLSLRKTQVKGLGLGKGARTEVWAGFGNYKTAITDPELWAGAGRVLLYGGILLPLMLGLALSFALILDSRRVKLQRFSRIAIFLPYAIPSVIASLLWGFLYLPAVSPFQYALRSFGGSDVDLLGPGTIYAALVNIAVWGGVGFNMLVLFTALRAIPRELYESARIDGCSEWQIAFRIKVPLITPSIILTSIFSVIATLQVFSEPTTLRPLTNSLSTTWTPLMKIYRDAFARNDIYTAAATSLVLALATLLISFGFLRLVQARAFGQES
jgi:multiple sugar transport system permease protein